jgi:hypothetical protein
MAGVRVACSFSDMATCVDLYTGGTLASDLLLVCHWLHATSAERAAPSSNSGSLYH